MVHRFLSALGIAMLSAASLLSAGPQEPVWRGRVVAQSTLGGIDGASLTVVAAPAGTPTTLPQADVQVSPTVPTAEDGSFTITVCRCSARLAPRPRHSHIVLPVAF